MESGLMASLVTYFIENPAWGILILTFFAYSMSYMLYSGYISWFAGGYGGIPLTQTGFNVIDLLTLVPTIFLLLFNILLNFAKRVFSWALLAIIIPAVVAFIVRSLILAVSGPIETKYASLLQAAGLLIWFLAAGLLAFRKENSNLSKGILILATSLAITLIVLFSQTIASSPQTQNTSSNPSEVAFLLILFLLTLPLFTFAFGIWLAEIAIREKLLSSVTRLVVKTPLPLAQFNHIKIASQPEEQSTKKNHWLFQNDFPVQIQPDTYVWDFTENELYLIAAFSNSVIFFVTGDVVKSERGKMLIVANEQVLSMEINSRKMPETK